MSNQNSAPHLAAAKINQLFPAFKPKIGIVLGSGLGNFVESLTAITSLKYDEFIGFPKLTVQGHSGNIVLGKIGTTDIVCLQGRAHSYEGTNYETVKTYVRMLHILGCEYFLATNAAGSMREDVVPGELMLITDHFNTTCRGFYCF